MDTTTKTAMRAGHQVLANDLAKLGQLIPPTEQQALAIASQAQNHLQALQDALANGKDKTVGSHRFYSKEDGTPDWSNSAGVCLERLGAMIDIVHAYVSECEEGGHGFAGLRHHTLTSMMNAMEAETRDVKSLLEGWEKQELRKDSKS